MLHVLQKNITYDSILIKEKDGGKQSQLMVFNDVERRLTYEKKDLKEGFVDIYRKPKA